MTPGLCNDAVAASDARLVRMHSRLGHGTTKGKGNVCRAAPGTARRPGHRFGELCAPGAGRWIGVKFGFPGGPGRGRPGQSGPSDRPTVRPIRFELARSGSAGPCPGHRSVEFCALPMRAGG